MKLIDDIAASLDDAPVSKVLIGLHWTVVVSRNGGLATTTRGTEHEHGHPDVREVGNLENKSALELVSLVNSESPVEATVGMAAINSLLNVDESRCVEMNAGQVLAEKGRGRKVAVVGHFPFIPDLRKVAGQLWVLELHPGPGDLAASEAERVIPEADVVAITGSAFINRTIESLLSLCQPRSYVVVLGPTTPLSPLLLDYGVDVVSGTKVIDSELALRCAGQGATFRQMRGVRLLTMVRS